MNIEVNRDALFPALQSVINVVERRKDSRILANVLLQIGNGEIRFTTTDLEIELETGLEQETDGSIQLTVPARKFYEIIRLTPEAATVLLKTSDKGLEINTGTSRFVLAMLPAEEFPLITKINAEETKRVRIDTMSLLQLIEATQFAMAQQDVRFVLQGLMLEQTGETVRGVATDGHRLALCDAPVAEAGSSSFRIIVPKKAVTEISRFFSENKGALLLEVSDGYLRVEGDDRQLTTKLIDGTFPEYGKVVSSGRENCLTAEREALRQAFNRVAIVANEKFRGLKGIRLNVEQGKLVVSAKNADQESAEEELSVEYAGSGLEIGFNVVYLLDVLNVIEDEKVQFYFTGNDKSCLIESRSSAQYVVMPMRL